MCALLLLNTAACHKDFAPPPAYPFEDPAFKQANPDVPGLENDYPTPLQLLAGDTITVRTLSTETAEYEGLVIDDEGKVHVPVAGPVQVAGLAPHQAERTLEGVLQKFDRFVRVSVLVTGWGGHYATVIGAVDEEGQKTITPNMRVAELLAMSGGPLRLEKDGEISYIADLDGARLMRKNEALPINIRLALAGDPKHNVLVHPGDQLFVPAGLGSRIAVLGILTQGAAMVTYRPGIRITEALAMAGGVTINSDNEDIRLIRGPLKKPKVYQYDLEALVDGEHGDVQLAPGDVVFVTEHWAATMADVITRVAPLIALAITALNASFIYRSVKIQQQNLNELRKQSCIQNAQTTMTNPANCN
ncbi:MAG: Capsule polysaccharide export protein [Myxococcaceae bacterium]|nr:Capsule polysaccharide export protein [Myxococcaceae bacterium]